MGQGCYIPGADPDDLNETASQKLFALTRGKIDKKMLKDAREKDVKLPKEVLIDLTEKYQGYLGRIIDFNGYEGTLEGEEDFEESKCDNDDMPF